ncbi:MAG: TonB-dependent receptor [Bacteroidales bacterium]|nr:TonB-dependent receptor [Bacteroidales bacterium]
MKKLFAILVLAVAFIANAGNLKAQINVSGIVVDSLSGQGVPFATVAVATSPTSTDYLMTAMTDVDGAFNGSLKKSGTYYAIVRCVGKNTVNHKFTVSSSQSSINLGKIQMSEKIDKLNEVTVTAQKALVSAEAGKIKYNTEGDPDNKTATVLDMLRKVPMVTVDGDDQISINGNSSFVVYMNGRKNTMLSENPSDLLKAMPASSVKNIEVITDPGSKFDAEGAGGIINLITDTQTKTNQIAGNVSLNVTNRQQGVGAGVSVQSGKFAASLRVNANRGDSESEMYSEQEQFEGSGTERITSSKNIQTQKSDGERIFGNVGLEASYEIDKSNLIAVSGGYTTFGNDNNSSSEIQTILTGFESFINNQTSKTDLNFGSYNAGIDFQHLFGGNAEKNLTFSYKLMGTTMENNSLIFNPNVASNDNYKADFSGSKTENKTGNAEHTFQIDYSAPVTDIFTVEAGGKYIYRPKKSDGHTYRNADGQLTLLDDQTVDYSNNDNIGALYTQVSAKLTPKLSIRGGLRYEYTYQSIKYENEPDRNFHKDYDTWVPSATLNYSISMMQNLSFTYNMRINRPKEGQLNPYRDYSTTGSVSFGDPMLEVQKFHNFGVSYGLFSMKQNLNISLRYTTSNNGISSWTFNPREVSDLLSLREIVINPEDYDLRHNTYVNATKTDRYTGSLYYSIQIGRSVRFFTNATLTYFDEENSVSEREGSGFNGNIFANLQYTTPFKLKLSAGVMMMPDNKSSNGTSSGINMGIFSMEKSFCKDKLTFSFSAMLDLNHGMDMVMENYTYGQGLDHYSKMTNSMGRFGISISYKFGKNIQVKRAKNTIQNDDFEHTQQTGDDTPSMGGGNMGGGAMGGGAMGGGRM